MNYHFWLVAFLFPVVAYSQSAYIPLNYDYNWLIDRYEIKSGKQAKQLETTVKPYQRHRIADFVKEIAAGDSAGFSAADRFNLRYLAQDSWEWAEDSTPYQRPALLRYFYRTPSEAFHHREGESFSIHANPVLHTTLMDDPESARRPYLYTRGVEIRGHLDKKIGFYSYASESNQVIPAYIVAEMGKNNRYGGSRPVPGEAFYKSEKPDYASYYSARAYLTFQANRFVNVQFGHDRHFVGNGYRSLILSDFAPAYLFLKLNTRVWKLNYTNLFAKMTAMPQKLGDTYPAKYFAHHRLGINIGKNLNIGINEMVVFSRQDSLGRNSFEIDYLNPIIFYRFIEHYLGDPDNILIAMDLKWNAWRSFQLYGQIVLDELKSSSLIARDGWWGNKQALQVGFKYIDLLKIKNLDVLGEFNYVRPFMYAHYNQPEYGNYQHYSQPLAHPLQSNFYELLAIMRYQPAQRLHLILKAFWMKKGESEYQNGRLVKNWGSSLFDDYTTARVQEYGNTTGQGQKNTVRWISFGASYQVFHNFFIEVQAILRQQELTNSSSSRHLLQFGIRWNAVPRAVVL